MQRLMLSMIRADGSIDTIKARTVSQKMQALEEKFLSDENQEKISKAVRAVGRSVDGVVRKAVFDTVKAEGFRVAFRPSAGLESFIENNVSLISTISKKNFETIKDSVSKSLGEGYDYATIKKEILDLTDKNVFYADFVARDQLAKVTADVNKERQEEAGIPSYRWRTVGDNRVRPEHRALKDKEIFLGRPAAFCRGPQAAPRARLPVPVHRGARVLRYVI